MPVRVRTGQARIATARPNPLSGQARTGRIANARPNPLSGQAHTLFKHELLMPVRVRAGSGL
mgnify:CR=1 FL=1|jgi:hypothetical protein